MQWIILVEAPDQLTTKLWAEILRHDGIAARLAPQDVASYLGPSPLPCRLLVPEADAQRAAESLADVGVVRDYSVH